MLGWEGVSEWSPGKCPAMEALGGSVSGNEKSLECLGIAETPLRGVERRPTRKGFPRGGGGAGNPSGQKEGTVFPHSYSPR